MLSFTAVSILSMTSCDSLKQGGSDIVSSTEDKLSQETIDIDYMNNTVRAQDDFFEFSNGAWLKENPVPNSESRWGSFNELEVRNMEKLTAILEDAARSKSEKGSMNQLLGDYYTSFIDMETRNKLGYDPIKSELNQIASISSKSSIAPIIANLNKIGVGAAFSFGVGQDLMDVDRNTVYFSQGGIGLPNKEYYFDEDKADILQKYESHIRKMLTLIGKSEEESIEAAKDIVLFEKTIAEYMMAPAELRIPEKTYNKISRKDFIKSTGDFDMDLYLSRTGIDSFDSIVVGQPRYPMMLGSIIKTIDLQVWKNYLTWKVVDRFAGHLSEPFVEYNFKFYGTVLTGKKEMKPINEQAINEITRMEFGEMLGRAFVEKHYSESAQKRVNEMVDNLLSVFGERIDNLDWMSKETKHEATNKLQSIGRKLGFPSKWESFDNLKFSSNTYAQNVKISSQYSLNKNIAKLNKPVDKDKWGMPAHMINAYYHPLLNEIAFPAGIMQAPFFSDDYEDAVNYGRIGMVIGHEFTHGFDDMGSKFAADGSFNNWWTESDRKLFKERTEKLGNTYSSFCPIDGHCVNPSLTMGENIADLGGLTMAYHAYTRTAEFKANIIRKGYTPAQRFFISYAQLWKINYTPEELKNRIANDPHSPGMYRVNGPLMNCPEFFEAFNVKESDPMRNNESEIGKIW